MPVVGVNLRKLEAEYMRNKFEKLRSARLAQLMKNNNSPRTRSPSRSPSPRRKPANLEKFKRQIGNLALHYGINVNYKKLPSNTNLQRGEGLNYITLYTPNRKAYMIVQTDTIAKNITLAKGFTDTSARRSGYGTLLRAIPIMASKNTGFLKIKHHGVLMNRSQAAESIIPPSTRIVRKLGLKPLSNSGGEYKSIANITSNININSIKNKLQQTKRS